MHRLLFHPDAIREIQSFPVQIREAYGDLLTRFSKENVRFDAKTSSQNFDSAHACVIRYKDGCYYVEVQHKKRQYSVIIFKHPLGHIVAQAYFKSGPEKSDRSLIAKKVRLPFAEMKVLRSASTSAQVIKLIK
jgi:hypothetical protein